MEKKELPNDWKWVKLSEVVQILDNLRKPINSSERQKRIANKAEKELYPYYGATGQVGWIDDYLTDGEYILVGEDGAPFLDFHKQKSYKITGRTWVNNHAHILREKLGLTLNSFILHYLNSIDYRQYVNGTTRLKLTKGSLSEIKFPLPPITTQQAIVSKIEELFSELDKGIENLKTAQQQLKVYRQSVLKWAFEGKLTNELTQDLSDVDDLGMVAEASEVYQAATKQENKNGELPEHWKWIKLGQLFAESAQNGLYKASSEYGSGTPIIRIDGFYDGIIVREYEYKRVRLTKEEISRYEVLTDDILINRVNSMPYLGKCGLVKSLKENTVFESNIMKIRVKKEQTLPEYLTMYLSSKIGIFELRKNAKQAVNQASINQTDVANVLVPITSIKEQVQIVQEIEKRLSVAAKMEESINQSLLQAESLRQSILKKAFEGALLK